MGESRLELLAWLNQLTGLEIQKVEQCGRGYPAAQILDSIFGDLPLKKIDFNANTEVKYLANWKVVQTNMARHRIDKIVPIDRLVKCKMQDNLEFLQWCKKYWDQYAPGGEYDAAGRRGGVVPAQSTSSTGSTQPPIRTTHSSTSSTNPASRRVTSTTTSATRTPQRAASTALSTALQHEIAVLNETVAGLEKERDFYFNKLRDIEILIQTATEPDAVKSDEGIVKQIQDVLYSTEEGFEVPGQMEEGIEALDVAEDGQQVGNDDDDDEVF